MLRIIAAISLLLFSGCGYTFLNSSGSLRISQLDIGEIINATNEPYLQDELRMAITKECLDRGIHIDRTAPTKLAIKIKNYKLNILTERAGFAYEYEAKITVDIIVSDVNGERKKYKDITPPFIHSFAAGSNINSITADKESANEAAIRSLAKRIVTDIIIAR